MRLIQSTLLLLIASVTFGQFADRKAEKLYYKLDDAYMDYDYETILDNEEAATVTFLYNEDTIAANVYSFLAEAYDYEIGDFQQALDFYGLELQVREKIDPDGDRKDLFYNMATLQTELGMYRDAEQLLLQVKDSDEKEFGKESVEYFETTSFLIQLYNQTEQIDKIISQVDDLRKNVSKNSIEEAVTYKWEGDAYTAQGTNKRAEKAFSRGLDRFESNGLDATFEYASTLNSLGMLYKNMGRLPEAEEIYQEALSIIDRMQGDNEDARSGILGNLALVYYNLGDYDRAIEIQNEINTDNLDYYGEESFDYGISLFSAANTEIMLKRYQSAEEKLLRSKSIFELAGSEIDIARAESRLTELYVKWGKIDDAKKNGISSIDSYINIIGQNHWETTRPMYNLSNAYMIYDEVENAKKLASKTYDVRKSVLGKNHPLFAQSANQMAIVSWKAGETDNALRYYQETFDNYFQQINSFFPALTEEEKATFYYTKIRPGFEQYVSFIEDNASENKSLLGDIYDYQLSLKGLIMYATSKVRAGILASGDEELIGKFDLWIAQKEQLAKLFSATDIELSVRNQRIDSLTNASNSLEEELSKGSNAFGKNFANKKITWKDIQKTLKPGEAAVEMVRYRDFTPDSAGVFSNEVHYAAMVVRHDTEDYPEMIILRNGSLMEKKFLANYRNAIRYKISENYSYRLFWEPIARKLEGIDRIYFAPDGVYNQISIYTLQNPETKDYLLNEIDLAIVTNTKDLLQETRSYQEGGRSVFFGYPQYNMGAEEVTLGEAEDRGVRGVRGARGVRGKSNGDLERGASIPRGVRGNLVRYMRSFNGLAMLPGTKKEVELIDSLYAKNNQLGTTYIFNEALEGKIKELDNPNILHIATHGFFLELDPDEDTGDSYVENPLLRSGLILAGANNFIQTGNISSEQNGDDGILTAYEAMNLKLDNTDVVVLSACETGLGEIKNGEGVYGLQRAFQIAGADAIIMSMWTVDDNATQELMTVFYEEWLVHGNKQKAFNAAQKRLRDKYKKPYYWGAFVMIGE